MEHRGTKTTAESGAERSSSAELKSVERRFGSKAQIAVNLGLAVLSAFIIYTSINAGFNIVFKHALYLMIVLVMTAVVYPFSRRGRLDRISVVDIIVIVASIAGSVYVMYDSNERFMRLGILNPVDIVFGVIMLVVGLDIGRRVIGWALTSVSLVLILYAILGRYIPGPFGHRGFNIAAIVNQVYAGLEGYYGLPARMMILYVAPFILLGAFLEKTGAGEFFIRLAFSLTRRSTGGPAKAAVIGSAFMGSISGSAIANVTSTGVITIPMMKRIGYRPHVAAATEAAASTGGQIMPPIMGAVAFIMVELTQIPYFKIVAVAIAPIVLYFITVFTFVHLEAKKHNIGTDNERNVEPAGAVLREGWHFFFVILVIVAILAFGYAPNLAALGGIVTLLAIHTIRSRKLGLKLIYEALVLGGKYSLSIGSLVACIGIILAMVGLTGVGLKLSWLFSALSGGVPFFAILLVGLVSLILGMGLASGPAYIVTAVAVGPALLEMGFPVLIAHFIMIWFSIDSEITPPVGLASIVGAGIAKANPMKTMMTAFKYAKGLYILPFIFYYRPAILLQGALPQIVETIASVLLGLIAFAAFWENHLLKRTALHERAGLLLASAGLLWPDWRLNAAGLALLVAVLISQRIGILRAAAGVAAGAVAAAGGKSEDRDA